MDCHRDPAQDKLPPELMRAFGRLRIEFLAAANSYPELNLCMVMAKHSANQMLAGPPAQLWRGDRPLVWTSDVVRADRTYRSCLWGDDGGLKRFERLLKSAERCLNALPDQIRGQLWGDCGRCLGWMELVEYSARRCGSTLLHASRKTWDEDQLFDLDAEDRVVLHSRGRRLREIFGEPPDYYITLIEADAFSASAYTVDLLLGNSDIEDSVIVVRPEGTALRKATSTQKRRRRPNTELTAKELEALAAYQRTGSFEAAAVRLGKSREAVRKLYRSAERKMGPSSRSVKRPQKLPADKRGDDQVIDE